MNGEIIYNMIVDKAEILSFAIFAIMGAIVTLSVGLVVFYFGWRKLNALIQKRRDNQMINFIGTHGSFKMKRKDFNEAMRSWK